MVNAVPDAIILPTTFKDDKHVEAPETNKLVKLVLLNIVVDVAFKLLIDVVWPFIKFNNVVEVTFKLLINNVELFDILFKLLNIVFDVDVKLLSTSVEFVDKLFTFVVNANTDMLVPVAVIVDVNCVELSAIKEAIWI